MEWIAFLSQPITQAGGIVGLLTFLHKSGLVDIRAAIRSLVGIDSGVNDVNGDMRNALQPLLSQMELLSQYANHDTTEMHKITHEKLEKFEIAVRDNTQILKEIKEYGIKCRDE
jgi:hypothetical protein